MTLTTTALMLMTMTTMSHPEFAVSWMLSALSSRIL